MKELTDEFLKAADIEAETPITIGSTARNSLAFALDFDDTFTAAPELWARFIELAESMGHRVLIVTARMEADISRQDMKEFMAEWKVDIPIIFTSLRSKMDVMEKRGTKIDIWIDDNPHAVVHGH